MGKKELMFVKDVSCNKVFRQLTDSSSSNGPSSLKRQQSDNSTTSNSNLNSNSQSSFISNTSIVSILQNQNLRKRKTSFLGGNEANKKKMQRSKSLESRGST